MMRLSGNLGFITNSSSAIFHFPRVILEDPRVKSLMNTYELTKGHVGKDLWHRGECGTLALTPEQKQQVLTDLSDPEYCSAVNVDISPDTIIVIYGDEYTTITSELADVMREIADEQQLVYSRDEYN